MSAFLMAPLLALQVPDRGAQLPGAPPPPHGLPAQLERRLGSWDTAAGRRPIAQERTGHPISARFSLLVRGRFGASALDISTPLNLCASSFVAPLGSDSALPCVDRRAAGRHTFHSREGRDAGRAKHMPTKAARTRSSRPSLLHARMYARTREGGKGGVGKRGADATRTWASRIRESTLVISTPPGAYAPPEAQDAASTSAHGWRGLDDDALRADARRLSGLDAPSF
ncbi:hypothetical protein C8Q73DRAFT_195097 [Cubamyces lactineus]|nr:hypothetical protein C8Q73DRAFT_195097 [Cubamyces lactineus]